MSLAVPTLTELEQRLNIPHLGAVSTETIWSSFVASEYEEAYFPSVSN